MLAGAPSGGGESDGDVAPAAPAPAMEQAMGGNAMLKMQAPMPEGPPVRRAGPRKVFHEGWISLKTTDMAKTLDSATKLAESIGGYVESRNDNSLVVRLPVEKFRDNFDRFVLLGALVSKSQRADDITELFLESELRLKVAKASLERLTQLLAESRDANEKLQILRQIQRLSEQIEREEANKKDLAKKAAFSRLTLNVQPFIFESESSEPIGAFAWIHQLNPLRTSEYFASKPSKLKVPEAMVDLALDPWFGDGLWAAAASDGSELWSRRLCNKPTGDAAFWLEAIAFRQAKSFAKSERLDAGKWKVLRLESYDALPYTWLIAVTTDGDELQVAEAFFPDPTARDAHMPAVLKALQEVAP